MTKKPKLAKNDLNALEEAMKGTKRLRQNKVRLASSKPSRVIVKPKKAPDEWFNLVDFEAAPPVGSDEFITYKQVSISNKILRKLRKGQYNIEAVLDLHGMHVATAKKAVEDFLNACLQLKLQVVLIIHGKGQHSRHPILKNKLNHWLRSAAMVLAFCSATPVHGSRGAIYVLLKKVSSEESLFE